MLDEVSVVDQDTEIVTDVVELARRLDALEASLAETSKERDGYRDLYFEMLERCRKLERGLLAQQKSERLPKTSEDQLALDVLSMALEEREAEEPVRHEEVRAHKRKKPTGRQLRPEDIPRIDIEVLPPEVQREGLDAFERIGEETSEVMERRPASFVLVRTVRPKFVRKDRDRNGKTRVYVAPVPELPIPRSVAGPGMLADTLVRRWQDHLPLNRLEDIYQRDGVTIGRSLICGWHDQLAPLVQPLVAAMRADAFKSPYICTDATGVLVQAKGKCRASHFWVLVAPGRHVLFEYTKKHDNDAVDDVLAGYEGYLVADAHAVYDHLYADGRMTEVNCWAHARRYFFKALTTDPERAKHALEEIGALFKIERAIATAPRKKRERVRDKSSRPIVNRFFSWCDTEVDRVLDGSPIADGIRYARNQQKGLSRFLEDGRLPLDNNISERQLRRQAVGRKNWLFVGSDRGGEVNALFTSLLASCRMLGVEPWAYLRDILCLLPRWPVHRVLELAPVHWLETRERPDVQALLEADIYRTATVRET